MTRRSERNSRRKNRTAVGLGSAGVPRLARTRAGRSSAARGFGAAGLDGKKVKVEETAPGHFKLTIPPFKFIGFSDPEFKTVHQHGQVLSFATADIDTAEGINEVLNEGKRKEHIQLNHELLKEQAKTFYEGIIRAIDTEAKIEFEFQTAAK